jgi:hypothetical protein
MPFVNLPEKGPSRWGDALTDEKMKKCVWLRPEAVAQIEFLERTDADRLRHAKFVGLRDDKEARRVIKEHADEYEPIEIRSEVSGWYYPTTFPLTLLQKTEGNSWQHCPTSNPGSVPYGPNLRNPCRRPHSSFSLIELVISDRT